MPANYDKIAGSYDLLSRLVFGKSIVKAQVSLLKYIPANSRLLIVGGGTGWILEELARQHPAGLRIDYVEVSAQMTAMSKKRNCGNNSVNFIKQPIENFTSPGLYDVIFTPFIFDILSTDSIVNIFNILHALLKSKGLWLYADFVYNENEDPLCQRLLLKAMYLFFRITCRIETDELINMNPYFGKSYEKIFEDGYYFGFIKGVIYQKGGQYFAPE